MLRSLGSCFTCCSPKANNVPNQGAAKGPSPQHALSKALKHTGNTRISPAPAAGPVSTDNIRAKAVGQPLRVLVGNAPDRLCLSTDGPLDANPACPGFAPAGRYSRKSFDTAAGFTHNRSCLRPNSLVKLLESFKARDEQDAYEHFQNVCKIVHSWRPGWQSRGWPTVAKYCLTNLSGDDLPQACHQLIAATNELDHCVRESVLRCIIDQAKYAQEGGQGKILLLLLATKNVEHVESYNLMMYEFIQHFQIDKLPDDSLTQVCAELLKVGANLCEDIQEKIARNIIYAIKLIPQDARYHIMIGLMEQTRLQGIESREYVLEQLSLEIYHLPLDRIVSALAVMLKQLELLPRRKQKPVMTELCYQLRYMKLEGIRTEVIKLLSAFTENKSVSV